MERKSIVRVAWITAAAFAAVGALGTLLVRDQISRHRRNLFSPNSFRRLAALGYLTGRPATVDTVLLLRDYLAWEPRPMLRKRAEATLEEMERSLAARPIPAGGV